MPVFATDPGESSASTADIKDIQASRGKERAILEYIPEDQLLPDSSFQGAVDILLQFSFRISGKRLQASAQISCQPALQVSLEEYTAILYV